MVSHCTLDLISWKVLLKTCYLPSHQASWKPARKWFKNISSFLSQQLFGRRAQGVWLASSVFLPLSKVYPMWPLINFNLGIRNWQVCCKWQPHFTRTGNRTRGPGPRSDTLATLSHHFNGLEWWSGCTTNIHACNADLWQNGVVYLRGSWEEKFSLATIIKKELRSLSTNSLISNQKWYFSHVWGWSKDGRQSMGCSRRLLENLLCVNEPIGC